MLKYWSASFLLSQQCSFGVFVEVTCSTTYSFTNPPQYHIDQLLEGLDVSNWKIQHDVGKAKDTNVLTILDIQETRRHRVTH
mmetsp:Transcript_8173/g.10999  ORF Transcript_8173/g.10999 Transcript_8173/m.10999 type:complete len:82 (-) Transcript_8173:885-1130(-)